MDEQLLRTLEEQHGLTPGLLKAVMMQESGGKADAVSPRGAKGWFQFMPDTAKEYGVKDPTDFAQAAQGAAKYLQKLHGRFGNTEDALRAYNWGQGNLANYKKGVRKDMPTEAQEYPRRVLARMDPPDLDALPDVDLPDFDALPDVDDEQVAAPKSTEPKDWQAELENLPGTTLLPTLGGIGGGIVGGAVTAPTVAGAPAGVAAGGTLGALGGYMLALRNSDAPAEEKAKFLLKKFNQEALLNLFGAGAATKVANMLAKTPAEKIALDRWFQQQGSNITPITDKALSTRAGPVYQEAVRQMDETVNSALGQVMRQLNTGGSPTQMGKVYQEAFRLAKDKVNEQHGKLFAKYDHGTTYGNIPVKPNADAIDLAKRVLRNFKDTEMTQADAGAAAPVIRMLEKIVQGKPVPVAEMVNMKRALANTADWDAVGGSYDNSVRRNMSLFLDDSVEDVLIKTGPDAIGGYRSANRVAHRQLELMTDNLLTKMANSEKVDPLQVAEFVAKNATPTTINTYKKALGLMVNKGTLTKEQNEYMMDNVRRNWIELNMKDGTQAARIYDSIIGGRDAEAAEVFNAVFNKSPYKSVIEDAAKAAHAIGQMSRNIPGHHGVAGEYAAGMSVAGAAGGPAGATAAASGLWLLNVVPRALAKSALRNDKAVRNKVRFVVNWMNQASPDQLKEFGKGTLTAAPANVVRAYTDVEAYLNE